MNKHFQAQIVNILPLAIISMAVFTLIVFLMLAPYFLPEAGQI